jgi:thioredoxin-like negative regulator of GroEL
MEQVRAGFIAHALENGLSESQATQLWKRAQEYPETPEVFKNLGADPVNPEQASALSEPQSVSEDPSAALAQLAEQHKIHEEMMAMKNQLGI